VGLAALAAVLAALVEPAALAWAQAALVELAVQAALAELVVLAVLAELVVLAVPAALAEPTPELPMSTEM
jgi:hypothetical protein